MTFKRGARVEVIGNLLVSDGRGVRHVRQVPVLRATVWGTSDDGFTYDVRVDGEDTITRRLGRDLRPLNAADLLAEQLDQA